MAVNTILLDFSVDPSLTKTDGSFTVLSTNIENVLRDFLTGLKTISSFELEGSLIKIFTANRGTVVNLRIYSNGLVTLNIDYYKGEKQEPLLTLELSKIFEQKLAIALDSFRSKMFPPIKRGIPLDVYLSSSDERILEYDIDNLVFEEVTPYQKVQIVHSKTLGNMLVLDDLQNIAESDLIYTETLMQRGKENYKDKEIVILGGGDGALLYELLKEKPKEVIMLEIDDVVMKACAKYMRSICGDVLDNYSGANYKIIVGDCMKSLEQYIKEGRKFDYIFGDLTDVPISEDHSEQLWAFINKILQMSCKVLKPTGKFMTHLTGTSCPEAVEQYSQYLQKLQPSVKYTMDRAFVPSFLEEWVFCQVSFSNSGPAE
ncbi:spermine synthase isoform X2 [Rhynchophorus ferrugineus]|uniref:spermine synthase isoform X2 n=1 Tax=Rhynchophorus ferrugineus TaxID=354439 RepID=UPI003FCCE8CF